MALRFVDGCSHYGTDSLLRKWAAGAGASITESNPRRASSKSILLGSADLRTPTFTSSQSCVVGFAVRFTSDWYVDLRKSNQTQVRLAYTSGVLYVFRGTGTILAALDVSTILEVGEWYYIELRAAIDDSAGEVAVHLDGSELSGLTLTGVDTKPALEEGVDRVTWTGEGNQITDIYCDSTTMHGDCVVDTIYPVAVGDQTDWTPRAGANWQNVDDPGEIDDDATYTSSATQGHRDSHVMATSPARPGSVIHGLAVTLTGRKAGSVSRVVSPLLYVNHVNYTHADPGLDLAETYLSAQRIWEEHPERRSPWTETEVNGAQAGYELVTAG